MMTTMTTAMAPASTAIPAKPSVERQRLELPVVQGWQSGSFYWMTTVSIAQLGEYFRAFFERDRAGKQRPLSLAQRTLNITRARKVTQYILKGCLPDGFYVLPPVTVTVSIPPTESFEFYGVDFGEAVDLSLDAPETNEIGTLSLPPDAQFWLADGQHRVSGAMQAYLEGAALVGKETLGMMLIPDANGAKGKAIFLDINKHAAKPSQSIIALFDSGDPSCEIARDILTHVSVFEGRTALEATNAKGTDLFTMNGYGNDPDEMLLSASKTVAIHGFQRLLHFCSTKVSS